MGDLDTLRLIQESFNPARAGSRHNDHEMIGRLRFVMLLPSDWRKAEQYMRENAATPFVFDQQRGLFVKTRTKGGTP